MAEPRIFTPTSRLREMVGLASGSNEEELIADADIRVARQRDALREFVFSRLNELQAYQGSSDEELFSARSAIAVIAIHIADVAAAAALTTVGEIAGGIQAMLEAGEAGGIWHTGAMRLHLRSLQLVRDNDDAADENALILQRLATLRRAVGVAD
ncbi:MAG: hypothetical protein EON58_20605 [Alphaproteobacteria bacterium]|nr:MAG: hypothetical protein EON58_20605 [Alphaproteobacteria bacterium]